MCVSLHMSTHISNLPVRMSVHMSIRLIRTPYTHEFWHMDTHACGLHVRAHVNAHVRPTRLPICFASQRALHTACVYVVLVWLECQHAVGIAHEVVVIRYNAH